MLARTPALLEVLAVACPVARWHAEHPVPAFRLAFRLHPMAVRVARLDGAQRDDGRGTVPAAAPLRLLGLEVGQRLAQRSDGDCRGANLDAGGCGHVASS